MPKVSVFLCTFNGEKFLPEQLSSVSAQTRLPDELIAIDDSSSDDTMSILHDFAAKSTFPVQVLRNEHNLGVTANFARAVSACSGDFIVPCDQDDIWLPNKLATLAEVLEQAAGRFTPPGW